VPALVGVIDRPGDDVAAARPDLLVASGAAVRLPGGGDAADRVRQTAPGLLPLRPATGQRTDVPLGSATVVTGHPIDGTGSVPEVIVNAIASEQPL
jgi:hypothetical protein